MVFYVAPPPPKKKNEFPKNCQSTIYHLHCFSSKLILNMLKVSMKNRSEFNYAQKILLFYLHSDRTSMNFDMT